MKLEINQDKPSYEDELKYTKDNYTRQLDCAEEDSCKENKSVKLEINRVKLLYEDELKYTTDNYTRQLDCAEERKWD